MLYRFLFTAVAVLTLAGTVYAGPNAQAVLTVDIDNSLNQQDDGNTSGVASAGTDIIVEVFIKNLAGPIVAGLVVFDTDKLTVKSVVPALGFFFP